MNNNTVNTTLNPAAKGAVSEVRFRMTERMLERFAELTGDRSPLHTDPSFARRSIYREQVVHGMAPLGFLSMLGVLKGDGLIYSPVELTGRFVEPIFVGDALSLSAEVEETLPEEALLRIKYVAQKIKSKAAVAKGTVALRRLKSGEYADEPLRPVLPGPDSKMTPDPISLQDLALEEISKENTDCFRFIISQKSIEAYIEWLQEGLLEKTEETPSMLLKRFYFPNLLATLLYSTSVGMRVPGRSATFLEFTSKIEKPVRLNTMYTLRDEVAHVSRSTRMIKKRISIYPENNEQDLSSSGKVSVLVNEAPRPAPSIRYLKESALDMGLREKVVLITGASRGVGETTAKLFALLGAKVVVNFYRGKEDADRIVAEIKGEGGEAFAAQADVSDPLQTRRMTEAAVQRYGTIHILVNNAVKDFRPADFLSLTWEEAQADLDVIVKGAFHCCQAVIPLMLEQGGGKIINISTVAVENPPPSQTKYVVAKSALVGLSRSLAVEFASKNIQVNLVTPGFVETDLVAHIPEAYRKKIAQETPMGRNASPSDVAKAIVFLASSYASFTTGQQILVTGGGAPYL